MPLSEETEAVRRSANDLYGKGQKIWIEEDAWNARKKREIEVFILKTISTSEGARHVLDAGSGNTVYHWMPSSRISIDRFISQLSSKANSVVCDLEVLPFPDDYFDLIFCIGSVLNYVSAMEAIQELARVLKRGGRLYLHFETSSSFEQLGNRAWNSSAHLHTTINSSKPDKIWIYSPRFIFRILTRQKLKIIKQKRFHIFSALLLRFGFPQQIAAKGAILDRLLLPARLFADDVIVLTEKT